MAGNIRSYDKTTNIHFFYDKIATDRYTKVDFERISKNFFIKGEKINIEKFENQVISNSFTYNRKENVYYIKENGYLHFDESQVIILPFIYVDARMVNAYAIVPIKSHNVIITPEIVNADLELRDFKSEGYEKKTVVKEIIKVYNAGEGDKVFICTGILPTPTIPDSLNVIEQENEHTLAELHVNLGNDFLFYEELNFIKSVSKGEIIGRYIERKEGKDGTNIFGNPISFSESREVRVGENLKVLPQKDVVAEMDGHLKMGIGGVYRVKTTEVVEGSLNRDLIFEDETDILINENVSPGVHIVTKGSVTVLGNVEGAHIQCDGEVVIGGGVTSKSRVSSKLEGEFQFISFSEVDCSGNIRVRKYIIDSNVKSGGSILVKFNKTGHVTGGHITLAKHIEMNMLGSPSGKETIIEINTPKGQFEILHNKMIEKLENNNKFLGKLSKLLGPLFLSNPVEYLKKVSPEQQKKIKPIVVQLRNILKENKEITEKKDLISLKQIDEKKDLQNQAFVIVNEEVYDNVVIKINTAEIRTIEAISFPTMFSKYGSLISRKRIDI